MRKMLITLFILIFIGFVIRTVFGVFIIQPIKAIPEGVSIVYVRIGSNLNFIDSTEGILENADIEVSLMTRIIAMGQALEIINSRIIFKMPYSDFLYQSTVKYNYNAPVSSNY